MSSPEHERTLRGRVGKEYGLDVYVVEPANNAPAAGVVVIIPDAFGWELINTRLLADRYAERGPYKVYLPDFMEGSAAPISMLEATRALFAPTSILTKLSYVPSLMTSFIPWVINTRMGKTGPVIKSFFEQLRKDERVRLPVGAAGFSWGGMHAVRLTDPAHFDVDGKPLFDAAFVGHPTHLAIPGDIEKMSVPTSFAIGDKDHHVPAEGAETVRKLFDAKPDDKKGEIRVYANCGHGFALRVDLSAHGAAEDAAEDAEKAEDQCIAWFKAHLTASK